MSRPLALLASLVSLAPGCGTETPAPASARAPLHPLDAIPQGNGDVGALGFDRTAFGLALEATVRVSRPLAASCGAGCVRVADVPIESATARLDPPIADLAAPVVSPTGGIAIAIRGRSAGRAKLWITAVAGGSAIVDAIDVTVAVPDSFDVACDLDGFRLEQGLLVGAAGECEVTALAAGIDVGNLVPQAIGGIALGPPTDPKSPGFLVTATAPGRARFIAAIGGRSLSFAFDVVAESEISAVTLVDATTGAAQPASVLVPGGGRRGVRPRLVAPDGRSALGLEDRFTAGPTSIVASVIEKRRIELIGTSRGVGSIVGDVAGRRWEFPVEVE